MHIYILIYHSVSENLSSSVILSPFMILKCPKQYILEISHALAEYEVQNICKCKKWVHLNCHLEIYEKIVFIRLNYGYIVYPNWPFPLDYWKKGRNHIYLL